MISLAINYDLENHIKQQNLIEIRNEINRIRTKHSLSTVSFPALPDTVKSTDMVNARTELNNLTQSSYISTVSLTGLSDIDVGDVVNKADFNAFKTSLTAADTICVHRSDYSDYTDRSDRSNRGNDSEGIPCTHKSVESHQSVDAYWPSNNSYNSENGGYDSDKEAASSS